MRNESIDTAKGILLLLVIVGHVLQGSFTVSFPRYFIYGFHMPLFMSISGYLFSAHYSKINTSEWLSKSFNRAIQPWLLAVAIFALYLNYVGYYHLTAVDLIVESLTKPFYHLWFIPAWMAYQAVLRSIEKKAVQMPLFLWVSFLFSTASTWLLSSGQTWIPIEKIPIIAQLLHILRPQFFFYFVLGYCVKQQIPSTIAKITNTLNQPMHAVAAVILFSGLFIYRNTEPQLALFNSIAYTFLSMYLCLSLCFLFLPMISANKLPHYPLLNWIGKQSLLIYLWHPMAILFARYTISYRPTPQFYYSCITSTITILVLIYFYDRYRNH